MTVEKSRKALFIALIGTLVVGVVIAVVVLVGRDEPPQQSSSADKIKIEVRSNPTAEIRVDGKKIGNTPISLQYAKSDKEIVIEGKLTRHLIKRGGTKDVTYRGVRKLKLDRDNLVDFNYDNTSVVDVNEVDLKEP
jgi:hypothetical protein